MQTLDGFPQITFPTKFSKRLSERTFFVLSVTIDSNQDSIEEDDVFTQCDLTDCIKEFQVEFENKTNDLILNLTPEKVTQHSRIVTTTRKGSSTPTKMSKVFSAQLMTSSAYRILFPPISMPGLGADK